MITEQHKIPVDPPALRVVLLSLLGASLIGLQKPVPGAFSLHIGVVKRKCGGRKKQLSEGEEKTVQGHLRPDPAILALHYR